MEAIYITMSINVNWWHIVHLIMAIHNFYVMIDQIGFYHFCFNVWTFISDIDPRCLFVNTKYEWKLYNKCGGHWSKKVKGLFSSQILVSSRLSSLAGWDPDDQLTGSTGSLQLTCSVHGRRLHHQTSSPTQKCITFQSSDFNS